MHSATAVHDLPPPALAVRNLMEQVFYSILFPTKRNHLLVARNTIYLFGLVAAEIERGKHLNMEMERNFTDYVYASFTKPGKVCSAVHCHVSDASSSCRIPIWFSSRFCT